MNPKPSIVQSVMVHMIAVAALSLLVIGGVWAHLELKRYRQEASALEADLAALREPDSGGAAGAGAAERIARKQAALKAGVGERLAAGAFVLSVVLLLAAAHARYAAIRIRKNFHSFVSFFRGETRIDPDDVRFSEFARLAEAANRMGDDMQRASLARMESESTLKSIFDAAPIGIGLTCNQIIRQANDSLFRITGYSEPELTGIHWRLLFTDPDTCTRVESALHDQFKVHGIGSIETRWLKKDGTPMDILLQSTPVDPSNPSAGTAFTALDITLRIKAQRALRQEKDRFRLLLEKSPFGLSLIDTDNRYVYVNPKFQEIFGYTREDIPTGKAWLERAFPDPLVRRKAADMWRLDAGRSGIGEVRPRTYDVACKDGTVKSIHFMPVTMEDGSQCVIYEDVTEKRKLEAQLQQVQRMEAIGTLAGGIAHDFNNILSAISGNAEIALLNELEPGNPARYSVEQILKASERATELVQQILRFSRQRDEEFRPMDTVPIVKEVGKLIRASLPATVDIRMSLDVPKAPILAHPGSIHQVLMNLCTNAAHAMRDGGGTLSIGMKETVAAPGGGVDRCPDLPAGTYIHMWVSDTGLGMTREVAGRIFEPYFTTKSKGEGTGLGLSVVHGIVRGLNGKIVVESESGKGSRFDVFLPRITDDPEHPVVPPERVPHGTERILLVDDEAMMVDIGRRILASMGYTVDTRENSTDALDAFRREPFRYDLVITDMTMPEMTGDKLAVEMMKIRPDIPIILCTGYSEAISEETAREIGFKDYIMKPILRREIARSIRRALDGAPAMNTGHGTAADATHAG